jgi:DNA-binding response OmpR family regulator
MNNRVPPLRALIVEDDAVWRRIVSHTLEKHRVQVLETSTLAGALETLSTSTYDLILLDYELPDGRGLDLFDQMERSELGRVILVTGYADPHTLMDSRVEYVDGYLTKPFLSTDLIACLDGLSPRTDTVPQESDATQKEHISC